MTSDRRFGSQSDLVIRSEWVAASRTARRLSSGDTTSFGTTAFFHRTTSFLDKTPRSDDLQNIHPRETATVGLRLSDTEVRTF